MTAAFPSTVPAAGIVAGLDLAPLGAETSGEFPAVWLDALLAGAGARAGAWAGAWTGDETARPEPRFEGPQGGAHESVAFDSRGKGSGTPDKPEPGDAGRVPEDRGFDFALLPLTLLFFQPIPAPPQPESGPEIEPSSNGRADALLAVPEPSPSPAAGGFRPERVSEKAGTPPQSGPPSQVAPSEFARRDGPPSFPLAPEAGSGESRPGPAERVDTGSFVAPLRDAVASPPDRTSSMGNPPFPLENPPTAIGEEPERATPAPRSAPPVDWTAPDLARPEQTRPEQVRPEMAAEEPSRLRQLEPLAPIEVPESVEAPRREDLKSTDETDHSDAESPLLNFRVAPEAPVAPPAATSEVVPSVRTEVLPAVERPIAAAPEKALSSASSARPLPPLFAESQRPHGRDSAEPGPVAAEAPAAENVVKPANGAGSTARPERDPVVALRIRTDRVQAPEPGAQARELSGSRAEPVEIESPIVQPPPGQRTSRSFRDAGTATEKKAPISHAAVLDGESPSRIDDASGRPEIGRERSEQTPRALRETGREDGVVRAARTSSEAAETEPRGPVRAASSPAPVAERSPGPAPGVFAVDHVRIDPPRAGSNETGGLDAMPASLDRSPAAVPVASTESAGPAPPLREMRLELKSESNQTVELRIGGRGDDVRVELRTEDSGLAETFREDLPQLVESIERHGLAVETVGPAAGAGETRDIRARETFEAGTEDRPRKEHGSSDTEGQRQRRRGNGSEALFEDELAAQGGRSN